MVTPILLLLVPLDTQQGCPSGSNNVLHYQPYILIDFRAAVPLKDIPFINLFICQLQTLFFEFMHPRQVTKKVHHQKMSLEKLPC